jgi:hypothetical protein
LHISLLITYYIRLGLPQCTLSSRRPLVTTQPDIVFHHLINATDKEACLTFAPYSGVNVNVKNALCICAQVSCRVQAFEFDPWECVGKGVLYVVKAKRPVRGDDVYPDGYSNACRGKDHDTRKEVSSEKRETSASVSGSWANSMLSDPHAKSQHKQTQKPLQPTTPPATSVSVACISLPVV